MSSSASRACVFSESLSLSPTSAQVAVLWRNTCAVLTDALNHAPACMESARRHISRPPLLFKLAQVEIAGEYGVQASTSPGFDQGVQLLKHERRRALGGQIIQCQPLDCFRQIKQRITVAWLMPHRLCDRFAQAIDQID